MAEHGAEAHRQGLKSNATLLRHMVTNVERVQFHGCASFRTRRGFFAYSARAHAGGRNGGIPIYGTPITDGRQPAADADNFPHNASAMIGLRWHRCAYGRTISTARDTDHARDVERHIRTTRGAIREDGRNGAICPTTEVPSERASRS